LFQPSSITKLSLLIIFLFSQQTFAKLEKPSIRKRQKNFLKSVYLTSSKVMLDKYKTFSSPCPKFNKSSGSKEFFRDSSITYNKSLVFKFKCIKTENNSNISMTVYEGKKRLDHLNSIVNANYDGGHTSLTNSWLVDIDADKHLDLIKRKKSQTINVFTKSVIKNENTLEIYYWDNLIKKFVRENVDPDKLEKLSVKYNFKLPY